MYHVNSRGLRRVLLLACALLLCAVGLSKSELSSAAQTAANCLNETLPNGSRWAMCWERRAKEGIVFYDVRYTPPSGVERLLFAQANLAEIHVPYDEGDPRYFDVSSYGLGTFIQKLVPDKECSAGILLEEVLCKTITAEGYGYKYSGHPLIRRDDVEAHTHAQALTLFSVSQPAGNGQYNYVVQWKFHDDGSVEPSVGATGRLQQCTNDPRYGWPVRPTSARCSNSQPLAASHTHIYWWRLDIDLGGRENDQLEQIEFKHPRILSIPIKDKYRMLISPFTRETAHKVSPTTFRRWRVKDTVITNNPDRHAISYELEPEASQTFRGPSKEPWTAHDLYLTQYRRCEMLLVGNSSGGSCADNVTRFVNGETVTDLVLWYGLSFHHLPHDEDDPYMSAHWSGFRLIPRDMTATNPRSPTPAPIP